jgi:hypothetical protein
MDRLDRIGRSLRVLLWMMAAEIVLQVITLILMWRVAPPR